MNVRLMAQAICITLLIFSNQLLADVNVLVIGSTHSYSEGAESGVVHQKPFNPTAIATHLQGILSQDAAITGPVNVEFEDIYKTEVLSDVNYTSRCYSLAQHYMWPNSKAARMTNLRGEGARQWDYIVLCQDPYLMANMPGMVAEGVKLIKDEVAKSANPAQVVILAQWPDSSSTFTATQFNEIAYRVGNSAGLTVVPAGKAWNSYGSKDTSSNHPTPRGEYLAAAAIYSKLFNRSAKTSAYDYPSVGDAIADHALSVIQANTGVAQYAGTYTSFNPFQMKYLTKRVISYRETGSSTENGMDAAFVRMEDRLRITFTRTGYAGSPGTRWDFNYGRGDDGWEPEKQYDVNPDTYDWVYGFPMHHNEFAIAPNTMPYGIDKQYGTGGGYNDGTDLGIAYNMIRPGTREPDWPEAVRAIPIRLMWLKMREVYPSFQPLGDSTHMHPNLHDATVAFMYTLLTGRCPIVPEPATPGSYEWLQWLGHKIGYETAWQMSHLTTRAPGLRILPFSVAATSVTPITTQKLTVHFTIPPQSDVTVNVSISNANAAIVGSKQLVFTPQNYNIPQTVTAAGLPGSTASESFDVVFTTVSTDEVYNNLSDSWAYTNNRSPVTLTRVDKATNLVTAYQNLPTTINLNTAGATSSNTVLTGTSRGTVVWSGSNVIYTPSSDYLGKDGFSFATNNAGTLTVGYVEITVTTSAVNGMVSYRGNGSNGGVAPIDTATYAQNATVTVLGNTGNLTRAGYDYAGWNTAADGSGTNYTSGSTFTMGASGVILYAKWTSSPNYSVTYNSNSSTSGSAPSDQIKTGGVNLTLATNIGALTRTGYNFAGWNTAADGSLVDYAVGSTYSSNANLTLYAKWTPITFNVTYNVNSATSGTAPANQTKINDVTLTLQTNSGNLARTGHTFAGWNTAAAGNGTNYAEGATYTANAALTLYAKWTRNSYTVNFDANGGDTPSLTSMSVAHGSTYGNLATCSRAGYTFNGWYTAASGGSQIASATIVAITSTQTLYAQWTLGGLFTWDANGTVAGQTNGAGAWEGTNLWWNGTTNANWQSGNRARFGGPNTVGGAVTLAAPTTVDNFTFNQFTGTYTLGTAGQAITLTSGINKASTSGIANIISPIVLGANQTWTNNSNNALTTASGTNLINNAGYQLTVDGTGITTFGVISLVDLALTGSGDLVKNGSGLLSIGGANTGFTGDVTINSGTLRMTNDVTGLGNGNLSLNGGALEFNAALTYIRALGTGVNQVQILGGVSGFSQYSGIGIVRLNNNNAYEAVWGSANFNPSEFVLNASTALNSATMTFDNPIDLNGTTRIIRSDATTTAVGTIAGVIRTSTGTAGLTKTGPGIIALSAANTYNGNTTISGGTLRIGNNTAGTLGNGNYAGNISIASGANLQIWSTAAQILSGTISGAGGLQKSHGGALTLSGTNTYSGRTSFYPRAGGGYTVNITSFNSVNGGTPLMASSSLGAPTTIANGTIDVGSTLTAAGVILNYTGPGETTDRVINFSFQLNGTHTLRANGSGLLKFTSAMTASPITTLHGIPNEYGQVILGGAGNGEITQALPALPIGGISKNDAGTWTLGGANIYIGPTAVTAGKLFLNGDQSLATGNVTVFANATLGGTGTIGGHTTINNLGKLEFNLSSASGSHDKLDLAPTRTLTFAGASTLTITSTGGASPGIYTLLTAPGGITGSLPTLILPPGWAATVAIVGNDLLLNVSSTNSTYAVTYNSNGATSGTSPSSQTKFYDVNLTLAGNTGTLARTGYVFDGWNTQANGLGTNYSTDATYTTNSAVTLYAKWTIPSYALWSTGTFANTFTDAATTSNPDGDNLTNLQEFAFGTDPTSSSTSPLSYVANGTTIPGTPILENIGTPSSPSFRAIFARRKNYVIEGITYEVQFSANLQYWKASSSGMTVLSGPSSSAVEAVSVPFPTTVPTSAAETQFAAPKFFRVAVSEN